ncbi:MULTISPECIES: hypothetical protein [unclassified Streptomyces]|uniref:DUF6907 domain-containing protein n=1 Tax=unclassified Streptomyces TaxID=2593676 RepID=UPI002259D085|nr:MULTISPECIES: hypothetical protein [unclassified Streptomyces]MCX4863484.1 hypothetical protein [Streptomyces sp. NBC_00906]MCX4894722.1 hypothetical protein [Streptomyces sp. NBC_00892]
MTTLPLEPATVSSESGPNHPPSGPRTWPRHINSGGQIVETCPAWCTDSHRSDDSGFLDDLSHGARFDGPELAVFDAEHGALPMPVLAGRINMDPYSEDPARSVPHIHLEPFQDEVMECLDPEEFAAVIAQVRAHCDRLDEVHAQLVKARAEYC